MNKLHFNLSPSKTQYDLYKYKIGDTVSYSKRKVYRYPVGDVVYDLRPSDNYKFLYKLLIREKDWENFKNKNWETYLHELDLYDEITEHLLGFINFNRIKNLILPEDLSLPSEPIVHDNGLELIVDWFYNPKIKPKDNQVYWVIFDY